MTPRRAMLLGLVAAWPMPAQQAWAAVPAAKAPSRPPPDADLLEFLGSVDSDEAGWHEFLENTDVGKVGAARGATPAKPGDPARGGGTPAQQGGVSKP